MGWIRVPDDDSRYRYTIWELHIGAGGTWKKPHGPIRPYSGYCERASGDEVWDVIDRFAPAAHKPIQVDFESTMVAFPNPPDKATFQGPLNAKPANQCGSLPIRPGAAKGLTQAGAGTFEFYVLVGAAWVLSGRVVAFQPDADNWEAHWAILGTPPQIADGASWRFTWVEGAHNQSSCQAALSELWAWKEMVGAGYYVITEPD